MLNAEKINVEQLSSQFWTNLKAYMKDNKISSAHIEALTNTPEGTVNRIKKDAQPNPTFDNVIGMVFGCNCSFDELFGIKKVTDETGVLISTELIESFKKQLEEKDKTIKFLENLVEDYQAMVHNMQEHCKLHRSQLTNK